MASLTLGQDSTTSILTKGIVDIGKYTIGQLIPGRDPAPRPAAMPDWILPVAIGGGALILVVVLAKKR